MKKTVAIVLIFALLVATAGCASVKQAKAYDIYAQANDEMSKIDSLIADTAVTMTMSADGQDIEVVMNGYVKEVIKSETEIDMEINMNTVIMGQENQLHAFYKDGVYYMQAEDQKLKMEMPLDQMMQQSNKDALQFPETAIKDQQVTQQQDGGRELSFTLDGVALTDIITAELGSITEMFGTEMSMTVGDVDYVVIVDADDNLKSTSMSFSMEMELMGELIPVSMAINMDIVQIGNVSIDFPTDLDTYAPIEI